MLKHRKQLSCSTKKGIAGDSILLVSSAEEQGYGLSTFVQADATVKITYVYKIESIRLQKTHTMEKSKGNFFLQAKSREEHDIHRTGTIFFLACTIRH